MKFTITLLFSFLIIISCSKPENKTKIIDKIESDIFFVKASSLLVREQPTINSKAIISLGYGDTVKLIEITNKVDIIDNISAPWYKIKIENNNIGYVFSGYLKETSDIKDIINQCYQNNIIACKNISNFYECTLSLESKLIEKYSDKIIRKNNQLILILENGKHVISNNDISKDVVQSLYYALREYHENIGYFIVIKQKYEGIVYLLINSKNGKSIEILGLPLILSPDKKNIIVSSCSYYFADLSGMQIINISKNEPVVTFEKKEFCLCKPIWLDNDSIKLFKSEIIMNTTYYTRSDLKYNDDIWVYIP